MKYQLIFEGELTSDVSEQEAVSLFAELFKVTEDVASKQFFSGRVVLKNLDDFQTAVRYRERLRTMGVVVTIKEVEGSAEVKDAGKQSANQRPRGGTGKAGGAGRQKDRRARSRKPLFWGAAVAALVVVVGVGLITFASRYTDTSVPASVAKAEAALLTPETILLGHANIEKLVGLEELLMDTSNQDHRYNPQGKGLLNVLLGHDINLRRDVDQVVFSVGYSQTTGSYKSAVFVGRVDQEALSEGLKDYYQVTETRQDGLTVQVLVRQDRLTCEMSRPIALISDDRTVVISHPDKVVALYQAVTGSHEPEIANQRWVDYRSGHLASIGLLQPDNMAQGQEGLAGMMLQRMSDELKGAESLFAGVSAEMVPPRGSIDVVLNSTDAEWVARTRTELDAALAARKALASEQGGFTAQLLNSLSMLESPGVLGARVEADGELVASGKEAFRDGIGSLFAMGNGSGFSRSGESQSLDEQLDEDAAPYQARIDALQLAPFEPGFGQLYHWQEGPLAVGVSSLRLNPDRQLEVEVKAAAQGIPNAPGSRGGDIGSLRVTSVLDNNGKELLAVETCGRDMNSEPASFESSFQLGSLTAEKTVRLIPNTSSSSLSAVEGELSLPVATRTNTTVVAATDGEATVEQGAMYLRIKSIDGSNVNYVVSGDPDRLLSLRGLNADRRYLKSASTSSMGNPNGGATNVSAQFYGDVAFVEVVTAVEWSPIRHRFRITNPQPLQGGSNFQKEPEIPRAYDLDDWSNVQELARTLEPKAGNNGWLGEPETVVRTEAGILSLFQTQVARGFDGRTAKGYVKLAIPYVSALDGFQGRAVLSIDELDFIGHEPVAVDHQQGIPLSFMGFGDNYKNTNKTEAELREELYLEGQEQFSIPLGPSGESLDGASLATISGELRFHLPLGLGSQSMQSVTLGDTLNLGETRLRVIGLETGSISVSADGDTGDILKILVLNEKGKQIGEGARFSEERPSGMQTLNDDEPRRMIAKITYSGKPSALRVITVTDTAIQRYPVSLSLE